MNPFNITLITIRNFTLTAEIAATPETRARGLMNRSYLSENAGMLFVSPIEQILSFWMKDTPLPLSVAFLDSDKRILNIAILTPFIGIAYSRGPAQYAIEVNQGWFDVRGIMAGDVAGFEIGGTKIL